MQGFGPGQLFTYSKFERSRANPFALSCETSITTLLFDIFSPNQPTGPIQSSSRDVRPYVSGRPGYLVPFPCNFFRPLNGLPIP